MPIKTAKGLGMMTATNRDRAEAALATVMETIVDEVRAAGAEGLTNADVARSLGLESDVNGGQRNHLTHGLLNRLVSEGRLARAERGRNVFYFAA